ncbi:MAG: hypothetical protein LBB88_01880 [Planctomycetaceae bacterium]|jgi:hypothetical protein|nr:hypothetical protein [Planctomycetaceae bacterium]
MLSLKRIYFLLILPTLTLCLLQELLAEETHFITPNTSSNSASNSASTITASTSGSSTSGTSVIPAVATSSNANNSQIPIGVADPVLGNRIAKISNQLREIPKDAEQIWREYDITPYTKGRKFLDGAQPEQTIVDWILRQTGSKMWHTAPFGILTVKPDKLYVYNTKNVQLVVADIVDRFVHPTFANESYSIRAISLSRPDWLVRGHQHLRPIPILSPGVQGWVIEKEGRNLLLQELAKRNDFKEIVSQNLISNGVVHRVSSKQQRRYLRDIQPNPSASNGYAEDWVTIDEGFEIAFVPLAVMDGRRTDAIIKLEITQIDKMIPLQIDAPTTTNPRQRIEIESPQVAKFNLDEQIRFPKDKVLLLDLGTIPLPNMKSTIESGNMLSGLTKNLTTSKRANILLMIEKVNNAQIANPAGTNPSPTITGSNMYWDSRK